MSDFFDLDRLETEVDAMREMAWRSIIHPPCSPDCDHPECVKTRDLIERTSKLLGGPKSSD